MTEQNNYLIPQELLNIKDMDPLRSLLKVYPFRKSMLTPNKPTKLLNHDLDGGVLGALESVYGKLSDKEYKARKHILSTRTGFSHLPIRSMGESEIRMGFNSKPTELELLAQMDAMHFNVEENYLDLLLPIIGKVEGDILLPYPTTVFHLNYRMTNGVPETVILTQDDSTKEIKSIDSSGSLCEHLYISEALAVCIALDAEIIGKTHVLEDLGRKPKRGTMASRTYKLLTLKTIRQHVNGGYDINTGRKSPSLHFRRGHWAQLKTKKVWRKSTIVGLISNGVVFKQYSVKQ